MNIEHRTLNVERRPANRWSSRFIGFVFSFLLVWRPSDASRRRSFGRKAAAVYRFGAIRRLSRSPAEHLVVFTLVLQQIAANVIKHLIIPEPMLFWLQFMKAHMTAKTITLRLSPDDYASATSLANRNKLSINKLFISGLRILDRQEQEKRLFDDFTLIGDQVEAVEVGFGLAAQSEVVEKP